MLHFVRLCVAVTAFLTLSSFAFAGDADFKLVNRTGYQVDHVYVSSHTTKSWGRDILGQDTLSDGESVRITFPRKSIVCYFDIKVDYHDGDTAEWNNVNLCQYDQITIYWEGGTTRAVGK